MNHIKSKDNLEDSDSRVICTDDEIPYFVGAQLVFLRNIREQDRYQEIFWSSGYSLFDFWSSQKCTAKMNFLFAIQYIFYYRVATLMYQDHVVQVHSLEEVTSQGGIGSAMIWNLNFRNVTDSSETCSSNPWFFEFEGDVVIAVQGISQEACSSIMSKALSNSIIFWLKCSIQHIAPGWSKSPHSDQWAQKALLANLEGNIMSLQCVS
jgi:hypothetical protein